MKGLRCIQHTVALFPTAAYSRFYKVRTVQVNSLASCLLENSLREIATKLSKDKLSSLRKTQTKRFEIFQVIFN